MIATDIDIVDLIPTLFDQQGDTNTFYQDFAEMSDARDFTLRFREQVSENKVKVEQRNNRVLITLLSPLNHF